MAEDQFDKDLAKSILVAKKKPRNFAIIAKGTTILKLLIDKKPIKDGQLTKAKKDCQGNAIVKGVVRSIGDDLVFQTTELPSITDVKLKAFLVDVSRLNLKARFELTPNLCEVDDDTSDEALETDAGPGSDNVQPTSTAPKPPTNASGKTETENATHFKAWAERLALAFKSVSGDVQAKVQPSLVRALSLGKEGRFSDAEPLLRLVEVGLAGQPLPTPTPLEESVKPDDAIKFTTRLKSVRSRYTEVIERNPPNRDVLEKAMAVILEAAKGGDFSRGLKVLDGLAAALDKMPQLGEPSSIQDSDLQFSDSLGAWETALNSVQTELAAFQVLLRQMGDPDLAVIANRGVGELLEKLPSDLPSMLKSARQDRVDERKAVRLQIEKHRQFLEGDLLITELDRNPFGQDLTIRATLVQALNEVQRILAPS